MLVSFVIAMVGVLLTTTPLESQERVVPGEPFLSDSLGWFFTDLQVHDLARDTERLVLLEERIVAMEELLALKDRAVEEERLNVDRLLESQKRSFWESVPPLVWFGLGVVTVEVLRE